MKDNKNKKKQTTIAIFKESDKEFSNLMKKIFQILVIKNKIKK